MADMEELSTHSYGNLIIILGIECVASTCSSSFFFPGKLYIPEAMSTAHAAASRSSAPTCSLHQHRCAIGGDEAARLAVPIGDLGRTTIEEQHWLQPLQPRRHAKPYRHEAVWYAAIGTKPRA